MYMRYGGRGGHNTHSAELIADNSFSSFLVYIDFHLTSDRLIAPCSPQELQFAQGIPERLAYLSHAVSMIFIVTPRASF